MDIQGKGSGFGAIFVVMVVSLIIAFFWDTITIIKNAVHTVLNPTAGFLLNWEISYGMIIIIFVLTFITTLTQKYGTDQETLKELKKEQKKLNEEMKEFRNDPAKIMELQKKQFEFMAPMMKISMRPIIYTGIPFLLFFRWFMDYFGALGQCGFFCNQYSIFYGWLIFYILFSIIFSIILRKVFDVA